MIGRLGLLLLLLALTGTASAAGTKAGDPQKRHNAADQAWAEAMRVQRSDLGSGDWRVEASNDDDRGLPKACKDPDLSDLVETGSAEEPDFSRNGSFVGSGSIVFQTERQMTTAWSRLSRAPLTECLMWAFQKGAAGSGVRIRTVSSGPVRMAKSAPHFKTARVNVVISGPAATVKGRFTCYLAAKGRASVILMVISFGRPLTPVSETLERRLATLVANRLKR
ncbi:hypothetical protein BH18ACT12_BH18ACT12_13130 [soil metagenome]